MTPDISKLIQHFGGTQVSMAKQLGVTRALISQWKNGEPIPALRALQIEQLSGGKFKAARLAPAGLEKHRERLRKMGLAA